MSYRCKQCGKHIHKYSENPRVKKTDGTTANLVTVHSYIIISHKRHA